MTLWPAAPSWPESDWRGGLHHASRKHFGGTRAGEGEFQEDCSRVNHTLSLCFYGSACWGSDAENLKTAPVLTPQVHSDYGQSHMCNSGAELSSMGPSPSRSCLSQHPLVNTNHAQVAIAERFQRLEPWQRCGASIEEWWRGSNMNSPVVQSPFVPTASGRGRSICWLSVTSCCRLALERPQSQTSAGHWQ